jgi:hypothetical protein
VKGGERMPRKTINIDQDLHNGIENYREENKMTYTSFINRAVERYLIELEIDERNAKNYEKFKERFAKELKNEKP